jgi:NaMN:DMB phosphoribosyltransferase
VEIPPLDDEAMTAAYGAVAKPGLLGKLDGLALWLAGVSGRPPAPLTRRRAVVLGESTVPAALAEQAGVSLRVAPAGGWDAGVAVADEEVDAGADLLVLCDPACVTTDAAAVVCALAGAEPVEVVSRQGGDVAWTRDVKVVRDALRAARGLGPQDVLDRVAGPQVGTAAGFLAEAARRRTPVLIDGFRTAAAALLADALAPGTVAYLAAGHRSPELGHKVALAALGLEPILDLGVRANGGALLAVSVLDAAVALYGGAG